MSDDKTAPRRFPVLLPQNILGGEFARNVWTITADNAVTRADLADPKLYESIADKVRLGDQLEIMPEDGSWFAWLVVRNKERATVKTGLLMYKDFEDAAVPSETIGALEVRWRGPRVRFGVVRKSDGAVLKENLMTRSDALAWAIEHERSFAA